MNLIWLQIGALVLLSAFLFARQWDRIKAARRADALRRAVSGKAFEATPLLMQMKVTRKEHLKLAQQHRRTSEAHQEFAASVGKSLLRLSFFSGRNDSHPETLTDEQPT